MQANQPKLVSRLLKLGAAVAFSPGEYPEATAIERIIIAANRHCPSSVRMLELADLSGVNRPFIVLSNTNHEVSRTDSGNLVSRPADSRESTRDSPSQICEPLGRSRVQLEFNGKSVHS